MIQDHFPWLFNNNIFPWLFLDYLWPRKFPDFFQFFLTCRNPVLLLDTPTTADTTTTSQLELISICLKPERLAGQVTMDVHSFSDRFLKSHCQTISVNMHIKYDVCSFNHVGAIDIKHPNWSDWPGCCAQTEWQTYENIISVVYYNHSAK